MTSPLVVAGGRGQFGGQCAAGLFHPDLPSDDRHRAHHGLLLESTMCYGTWRTAAGTLHRARRQVGWDWVRPLAYERGEGGRLQPDHAISLASASGSALEERLDGKVHVHASKPGRPGPVFRIRRTEEEVTWDEEGVVSARGWLVGGVGFQWYDPSPPGAYYASMLFRTEASLFGEPAEGFVAYDQRYLPPGHLWDDRRPERAKAIWVVFGVEWENGAVEAGHLCAGPGRFSFALVAAADGTTTVATDIELSRLGDDLRFHSGSRAWDWVREARAEHASTGPTEGDEGVVRAADGERPRVAMGRLLGPAD